VRVTVRQGMKNATRHCPVHTKEKVVGFGIINNFKAVHHVWMVDGLHDRKFLVSFVQRRGHCHAAPNAAVAFLALQPRLVQDLNRLPTASTAQRTHRRAMRPTHTPGRGQERWNISLHNHTTTRATECSVV